MTVSNQTPIQQYSTGTTDILIRTISIPPKDGIAIGTIISEPRPVEVRTGISASMVVAEVIKQGRTRRCAAMTVASRIC